MAGFLYLESQEIDYALNLLEGSAAGAALRQKLLLLRSGSSEAEADLGTMFDTRLPGFIDSDASLLRFGPGSSGTQPHGTAYQPAAFGAANQTLKAPN